MAAIDKIYGTREQWFELNLFLVKKKKNEYIQKYLYPVQKEGIFPISNFSTEADIWLWENCKLDFVIEALKEQYGENGP